MTLALFDLDHTLLQGDSDHTWGRFLVRKGLVDQETYAQTNNDFYQQYSNGTLDIHEYAAFALHFISQTDRATLEQLHREYMASEILPMISQKARDLVEWHRSQGHTLVIITATNSFVTTPIAKELNIPNLLAIDIQMDGERYTRKIAGVPTFREGKVTRLNMWLADRHETLAGSYFYSDSHNDLPLMLQVDHPIAVDPDPKLKAYAEQQGWQIISLKD
ncbi:HAD family hydrolase [Thiolinea disciformis]|uniref:histidinol-phosphatase n=1 Tax=Thiolinea disciformis TaxID=125614 RepID=UPI00036A54D5|nr:HAD family hydrolase [Thiolinea disciformis]